MPTCYVCDCEITENNTYREHNIVQTSIENVFKGIEEGSTINEDDYIRLIDNVSEKFAHFLNFKNRNF
jgi:hypothetical protein